METKNTSNNIGAISALKGYRVQFLYSLFRVLTYTEFKCVFRPEGEYEDLDVYNDKGEIIEIIQVKNLKDKLTLSDILSLANTNNFINRALKIYKEKKTPKIKLVSFGDLNDDIKDLGLKTFTPKFKDKLAKLHLNKIDIQILEDNFEYEILNEQKIKDEIKQNIAKWNSFVNIEITFDLLIYWIYYAAEKQNKITPSIFKGQFDKICKFQSERISFSHTYNTLIRPINNEVDSEDLARLKIDFYQGISATYKHILAEVDVPRKHKLNEITNAFKETNIVFIHGASGQGKSTLAYRFLKDYCSDSTVFELVQLPENIQTVYEIINSLEGISKGITFPITIYIDIEPGNKQWVNILKELASKKNFNFIITIREEDWNTIEVGDKFRFSEIELYLDKTEAELIYSSLNLHKKDLKFTNFEDAWDAFGGNGPLLEFVYLITQNESLRSKLKYQIDRMRLDSSTGSEKIKILRYIVLADCFGSKVKYRELAQFLKNDNTGFYIDSLQKEFLIKFSDNRSYIIGLHPVRSEIIKSMLFDNEVFVESVYALDSIEFISEDSTLNFLRNAFRYSNLSPNLLIEKLKSYQLEKWQSYLLIFKSLLWKGIDDYVNNNIEILNHIYEDYNNSWIVVVNFDFSDIMNGQSMMENSTLFGEEQSQYAKSLNKKLSDKKDVFKYCLTWITSIKQINIIPECKDDWDSLGLFLFWLDYLKINDISIDYERFNLKSTLINQTADVLSHVLYALKTYNKFSLKHSKAVENIFLERLSIDYNIISIEQKKSTISCYYLFDLIDESTDTEESDFVNAKSVKILELLRYAFPDKDLFETKGVGHEFSILPDNHDSSIKKIKKINLPLPQLIEINSTFINLFNYSKRSKSWKEYVDIVIERRLFLVEVLRRLVTAYNLSHKSKNYQPLSEYILNYYENYQPIIKKKSIPLFPKIIIDEWGNYSEGNSKPKKDFIESFDKKERLQVFAVRKYVDFRRFYNDFDLSINNFIWQSAENIFKKLESIIKNEELDITGSARISLVANLYKAYETFNEFQNAFKYHFEKYVNPTILSNLEKEENYTISILCYLYRQFIYSNSFLAGDVNKLALERLDNTNLSFKKKVTSAFKVLTKELNIQFKVNFEEGKKRCIIIADTKNSFDSISVLEIVYNKLFDILEQPDFTSTRHLVLNTKYPIFNIIPLVSGKSINGKWSSFKMYKLREDKFDELEQFHFMQNEIPLDVLERYNIEGWNKNSNDFQDIEKLLSNVSTAYQLAFHFLQLEYFESKKVESYNEIIIRNYTQKVGSKFQDNLQVALDLFSYYYDLSNNGSIEFIDETEKNEFEGLIIENQRNFYINDEAYEKRELSRALGMIELKEWLPRLKELSEKTVFIYYFLADKIINGNIKQ